VRSGDEFRLLLLEDDRDWLPSIGGFAKIRGTTAPRGDDTYIKTTSIVMLDESPWATAAVDDTPVELTWTDLGGQEQSLDSYRGRIVVLNFWATWCAPCRDEMPDLVRIQNHFGIYGVQVVGAAADPPASADTVLEFARRLKLNFPILLGADTAQMQSLGAGVALPATVVLDREGRIVEKIAGVVDRRRLESILERLVTSPQSAAVDPASDLLASGDAHGHGHDHDHPPHDGTQASLVPS
jgi:peroxiredoxin